MAILSFAVGCCLAVAGSSSAYAEIGDEDATPVVSGAGISITVTGTGVKGGAPGSPGGGSKTVYVKPPCVYEQFLTGKGYYELIAAGGALGRDKDGRPFGPNPGYEKYKDDDKGHWYSGVCSSADYDGEMDEFFDFSNTWFNEHRSVYVPENQTPPVPPVPPEVLRNVAFDSMEVPAPAIDWSPKYMGDLASVVNIDTLVWLKDRRDNLYVEASVNSMAGVITARVDAALTGMTVSGPNGESADCADGGVPYAPGAVTDSACSIRFVKASPGQSKSPVSVKTHWQTTWSANGQDRGATPEQLDPPPATTDIRVIELQVVSR